VAQNPAELKATVMNINEQLENVSGLLEAELCALGELEKAAVGKKKALVKVDLPSVEKWTAIENLAAQKVTAASESRLDAVNKMLKTLETEPGAMPLQAIAMRMGEPFKTRFLSQRTALVETIGRIRRTNEQNQLLSEESLRHVKLYLNAITGGGETQPRYTRSGIDAKPDNASRMNLVDQVA
jgi:hypothetical protein